MKKIGELMTKTRYFVIYYDEGNDLPYRLYHKWYDTTWHKRLLFYHKSLGGLTSYINDHIWHEEEGR